MNDVAIGTIYVMPALIVQTVLEGKKLNMGEQAAESVVQFVAFTLEPFCRLLGEATSGSRAGQ
jgi:hypothetical protein